MRHIHKTQKCSTQFDNFKVDIKVNTYTGLTCNEFKTRWGAHKHSFNNADANQTTLSTYLHELMKKDIDFTLVLPCQTIQSCFWNLLG